MSLQKYRLKIPPGSEVLMQKINNDLSYLIQFLDARYDLWLYILPKKTLSNQFNDMKMAADIKLASALNRHQGRQLCCVKREDLMND